MNNKFEIIRGFVIGILIGFLLIVIMSKIHPQEDLAGVIIFTCLLSGILFSLLGHFVQNYFIKNKKLNF